LKAKKNELISENKEKIPKIENEKEKKRKRTKRFRESPPQHRARLLSAESVVTSVFLFSQHRAAAVLPLANSLSARFRESF
jgi:hypothetical protein